MLLIQDTLSDVDLRRFKSDRNDHLTIKPFVFFLFSLGRVSASELTADWLPGGQTS